MAQHTHAHEGFEVQVERTDEGIAKVSFSVSPEEFGRTVAAGLQKMAGRASMKGFRKGKVPPAILEKQFGRQVREEAIQHFLNHAYEEAMTENDLTAAAHPHLDLSEISVASGEGFSYDFEVFLKPEFSLQDYSGLEIERQPISVEDAEVESALDDLRRQLSRPEPAGDDGLDAEGMAICKIEFTMEGLDEPLLSRDNIRLSPKTAPAGVDPADFEAKLTGAKKGDELGFPLTFPEEFPEEKARGKEGACQLTVSDAFRIVAPSDEELFEKLEVTDQAAMQDKAREGILQAKQDQEQARIEGALLEQVIDLHPMSLPPAYVDQQVAAKAAETRQNLLAQGLEEEVADAQVAEQMDGFRTTTQRSLQAVYLMEEIAKKEELRITEQELSDELEAIAARNQAPLEDVKNYYQENRMVNQLALELLERKIRTFLRESADIKEANA